MRIQNLLFAALCLFAAASGDVYAQNEVSGVYVGGHIRRERPGTITKLRESGFTYVILFNVDVQEDGTLKTDGETICENGKYVFDRTQPNYIDDIKLLKTEPTSISRIEICIGGWGNQSYGRIKSLIEKQGTSSTSMLYKNFKALKQAIPEIDAVNNDQEQDYDYASAAKFHAMMSRLGYKTTIAPYTYKSYWQSFLSELEKLRKGACDRVMIQCYDGGAGNNPSDWHLNNSALHAGLLYYSNDWSVEKNLAQFEKWRDECNVKGGFVWVYNDESWNLNAWASGMNRVFGAKVTPEEEVAVECFSENNYGGYRIGLPVGKFTKADLAVRGLAGNDLSSIKVKEGYKVKLYKTVACTGAYYPRTKDLAKLSTAYNNLINSILVEDTSDAIDFVSGEEQDVVLQLSGNAVNVKYAKGQLLQIFSMSGHCVYSVVVEGDEEAISLESLPRGMYIIKAGGAALSISL